MDKNPLARFLYFSSAPPPAFLLSACAAQNFQLAKAPLEQAAALSPDLTSYAAVILFIDNPSSASAALQAIAKISQSDSPPFLILASAENLLPDISAPLADVLLLPAEPRTLALRLNFLAQLYLRQQSAPAHSRQLQLALNREIAAREHSQQLFESHTSALTKLSRSRALIEGDLPLAVQQVCEAAFALQPERITVWIYDATCSLVRCVAHYQPPKKIDCSGEELTAAEFPNYFAAFEQDRVCRVPDTDHDPRGSELRQGRDSEPPIRAFLAVSFSVQDQKTGILRIDQLTGPRAWTDQEQAFLTSLSDLLALSFEASERRQAEESLRQSEHKLRLVLDNATEFAVLLLDQNGMFTECNPGAESILGYKEFEIVGLHSAVLFTPEDKAAAIPEKELAAACKNGRSIDERWHVKKDGSRFWGSGFMYSLRKPNGEVLGFFKIVRDITEQKLQQDRTQSLNEELEKRVDARTVELKRATEQMEAFCYTVSHDLRAPLRSMRSFSTILLDEFTSHLGPVGADLLKRINASAQRMDSLISDLLEYSRLGRLELPSEEVDLEHIVREALEDVSEEVRAKNAEVFVQHPLPVICANHAAIAHVITNLLTNALKFSKPDLRPEIKIFAQVQHHGWVRFSIQDNGIGIAPEHRDRIFRIFERLHASGAYPGTGVGLAIVRKSIERLGGRSGVESEPGVGSTFWFELKSPEA
jgi:PAS domain S-box-containing protein